MLAPVIIFGYNRKTHIELVLNALEKCELSTEIEVYIFLDGSKNDKDIELVKYTRSYIKEFSDNHNFKKLSVNYSKDNNGLSKSIIKGVTQIINKHEKVIVLEDDSLPNKDFLVFMNKSLKTYESNKNIGHIGGYTLPIKFPIDFSEDVFLVSRGSSCAWATWKSRWDLVDWDVKGYKKFKYNIRERYKFNSSGTDKSLMLDYQMLGILDSWAIRFSYSMFENKMYALLPRYSLIENIGFDGSGTNSDTTERFKVNNEYVNPIKIKKDVKFEPAIEKEYYKMFRSSFLKRSLKFIIFVILKFKK